MYTGAGTIMPISAGGSCTPALPTVCIRERPDLSIPPQNASENGTTRHLPLNGEG